VKQKPGEGGGGGVEARDFTVAEGHGHSLVVMIHLDCSDFQQHKVGGQTSYINGMLNTPYKLYGINKVGPMATKEKKNCLASFLRAA
jgi:hypothetical protein